MTSPVAFPIAGPGFARTVPAPVAVRTPAWRLTIEGVDVTRDITPVVTSVKYQDFLTSKSDSIEVAIADSDHRWQNQWYPTKSDAVELWLGYDGDPLLPCGRFEIDEVESQGPPDTMTIRALSTGVIPDLRTKRSKAFEGQLLPDVVAAIAKNHGLTVVGEIAPIPIGRMTQRHESDLSFLRRVADMYGYVFSVRVPQLVFHAVAVVDETKPLIIVWPTDVTRYGLKDKVKGTYGSATFSYHDAAKNADIKKSVKAKGVASSDVLDLQNIRAESIDQAEAQARAALVAANRTEAKGQLHLEGDSRIVAGVTIRLPADLAATSTTDGRRGWGKFAGDYTVSASTHELNRRDGYTTLPEIERAPAPEDLPTFKGFGGSGDFRGTGSSRTF